MIRALIVSLLVAVLIHAFVLLFGGAFRFLLIRKDHLPKEEVQEVSIVEETKEEKEEEKETKKVDKVEETPEDQMPDTTVLEEMQEPQQPAALSAASLSDLESALSGIGGGSGFGSGASFASGGIIGGRGRSGGGAGVEDLLGGGGGIAKPRLLSSSKPKVPSALKDKSCSITLVVWVGEDGRVSRVEVEQTTEAALEKPAIDAVRQWTFSPATRDGKKVPAKIRQTIQFKPASA